MEKTLNCPEKVMGKERPSYGKHPEIAQRLKEIRHNKLLSQAEMAKVAGVARPTWSAIENGYQDPTLDSLIRISKRWKYSMDFLFYGDITPDADYVKELEENVRVLRATVDKLLKE